MKLTVLGTGYVGLVTGACFAEMGNDVLCVDVDATKIAKLRHGELPIYEPGLGDVVQRNVEGGRLHFSTDVAEGVRFGTMIFIAVGTPPGEDGSADMQHVLTAARSIGHHMTDYKVVIDKSTVPVGTAALVQEAIAAELAQRGVKVPFGVVSNPEFLKEGAAVEDFMRPDRIVVGADDARAVLLMRALYAPFQRARDKLVLMDLRSAELTKYAANAMLATRISFMNEMALLAEKLGADIEQVRRGIGSDPRIGPSFLYPGVGFGGSCFPKDLRALLRTGQEHESPLTIVQAAFDANERQKQVLFGKAMRAFDGGLAGLRAALWGLAFKPDTDDIREAPALYMIEALIEAGATVTAFDPEAMPNVKKLMGDKLNFAKDEYEALQGADALIIATEWALFRTPDFKRVGEILKEKTIFDGRNLYDLDEMKELGFFYMSVGRQPVNAPVPAKA